MKGQITLEYMVLSLVVIALLSISVAALIQIRENSNKTMDVILFKSAARDLFNAIDEVCAMGDGNSREIYLKNEVVVNDEGSYLEFSSTLPHINNTINYECECDLDESTLEGSVLVTNIKGKITFNP